MESEVRQSSLSDWDFWSQGLDQRFFARVYLRATQIGSVLVLMLLGFDQRPAALGLLCGLAMGLFSTWTVEVTVRLLFNGGGFAGVKLAIGAFVKLPLMLGVLLGIAWAGQKGHISIFTVVGGVLLVHATMFTMGIATALANQNRCRERYR